MHLVSPWRVSVAPMMDWTDRHCRAFHRVLSRRVRLYTEMVTADAVRFGPRERLLGFEAVEHPVALQLGGSVPAALAEAARIGADFGYDEINLNVGCPSDRVQNGMFGACLMRQPALVADCVAAMRGAVSVPITVKCRIGVDDQDPAAVLPAFVDQVSAAGAASVTVHARKAWLQGLSPKENRDIPPLDYDLVYATKRERPSLPVSINGGVRSIEAVVDHLQHVDGVMIGRAAYGDPSMLLDVDPIVFGEPAPCGSPFEAVERMQPYWAAQLAAGVRLHDMTRHVLGLFNNRPGARAWRRHLATEAPKRGAGLAVMAEALRSVSEPTREAA